MQPKWITTRKPNKAEVTVPKKAGVSVVQHIKRRHRQNVKVRIATSEIFRPRELQRPSPEAVKKVEDVLTRSAPLELPEQAKMAASITLNKLDKLPPLRERASTQERAARKELPALVDLLNASVDALNAAHEAGDLKRAARAWGFACNIIGKLEAMFYLPEISVGRASLLGGDKGNQNKHKATRQEAVKIRAFVQKEMPAGGFTPTGYSTRCRVAAQFFAVSKRTVQRKTPDLKPRKRQ